MKQREYRKGIIYYLKVWRRVIKGGLSRSYLYKTDILVRIIRTVIVIAIQIFLLNTLFGTNEVYVGWTKNEAYLIIGIWNILNYLGWSIFATNLLYLESKVIEGKFDYVLLKPLSSSWYTSFSDFFVTNFVTALSGLVLVAYYIITEWGRITLLNFTFGILSTLVALLVWYAIYLFFASFTISNPRNGFLSISKELLGLTKYPIDVFGENLKFIFYTIIPLAFLTTVPANIIIGRGDYRLILFALLIGILLIILSNKLWNHNVKKYSSASS